MSEPQEIYKTLDLALRVGEMLLSNGAGAADVTATMDSITHHLGLRGTDVDVTFTALVLTYQPSPDNQPYIQRRNVRQRDIDYEDLTRVDHLVTALLLDEIDRDEARSRLAQIVSSGHMTPRWAITVGWGLLAAGILLLLGGDLVATGIAFVAGMGIDLMQRGMARRRLPSFYQQVAGGLLATLLAVGAAATSIPVDPSLVVTASIVLMLAGLGFVGTTQDALSGFYLTAAARFIEVMMATAGVIAGVSGGLTVGKMLGVDLALTPGVAGYADLPVVTLGAAVSAVAFAFVAYAPWRSLLPIAVIAAGGEVIFYILQLQDVGRAWAAAIAAIGIGVVSYTAAGRVRVPPLVIVVSGITPFLPGLSIYKALSLMSLGDSSGILSLSTAATIAIALASGVILGEYIAQPLKREARRLEQRLSGPRLVGPVRARAVRKS